jgi:holin-like protein
MEFVRQLSLSALNQASNRENQVETVAKVVQVLFFVLVWVAAQSVVSVTGLPLPPAVLGLFAVLLLLSRGWLPERGIAAGSSLLLGDMLLFFIPPLMAATQCGALLAAHGLQMLAAIGLGSLIVMGGTGLVVERVLRWERRRGRQAAAGSLA